MIDQKFLLETLITAKGLITDEKVWLETCCEDTTDHENTINDIDKLISDIRSTNG